MAETHTHVGSPRNRVDGILKVTGAAKYAAESGAPDLAHGYVVSSSIARGRIEHIETSAAEAVPGVIKVFTHENRPAVSVYDENYQDQVGPPGRPFRPLYDGEIRFCGQPVALVVAETFEAARYAASLVQVRYAEYSHETDLEVARKRAYVPPEQRSGISPPPPPRGNAAAAYNGSDVRIHGEYRIAREFHNPIELHATTAIWENGKLTIHEKTQGVQNSHAYIVKAFGIPKQNVRVISPFVGGAFGSGLRPQYQLFLATMAALHLKRSVRVELSRDHMFSHVHRPETINMVRLGAGKDGTLNSIEHNVIGSTSRYEDHQEVVSNWSGLLYHADNVALDYRLAQLDIPSPGDMRAPGAPLGIFALETAMDELACAAGIDPLDLRIRHYTRSDENKGRPYSSKELMACYRQGADLFGWSGREPRPRSMREGRELIGWGMATGVWDAAMTKTAAKATLNAEGKLEVATATADVGTGTYTILTQIAADVLGLPMEDVAARIGDSSLPTSPVEGGSWTAASAGSAVQAACHALRRQILGHARKVSDSPLANADIDHVLFRDGRISLRSDPARSVSLVEVLRSAGLDRVEAEETSSPDEQHEERYSSYTHSAVFAEVRVDEELAQVRVTRIVSAVAAGKILNPKTARSQIVGGVVWGIGMALHEEGMMDHRLGRPMNHNIAEYHIPVNADVHQIDVIFVDEDDQANALGVKGLGEIGIVGTAAAIGNAIHHATGIRLRELPITIDKILRGAT